MLRILPYIEQAAVSESIKSMDATNRTTIFNQIQATRIKSFVCPSDVNSRVIDARGPAGLTSYIGITGNNESSPSGNYDATNGVFGTTGVGKRFAEVSDGTSNTIAIAERPSGGPSPGDTYGWWIFTDGDTLLAYPNRSIYKGACASEVVPSYFYQDDFKRRCHYHHIWSGHPGGGMFAFGDGSVRFMAYAAANPVLVQMASTDGGEAVSE